MNMNRSLILALLIFISPQIVHGQVLISLLFGEKLNSDKIEFGLEGGLNRSYFLGVEESNGLNSFNLGFYFHFLMKKNSHMSTGVLVKSNVGASGMSTYPIGNEDFDSLFANGDLTTKINYFYVPILFHQRFNQRWYIEGGVQLGMRGKAYDIFTVSLPEGDLKYETDVRDSYTRLDAGLLGGIGYKFKKRPKSLSIGVNYYYGLVDVSKLPGIHQKNASFYLYVKMPIGAGKSAKEETTN